MPGPRQRSFTFGAIAPHDVPDPAAVVPNTPLPPAAATVRRDVAEVLSLPARWLADLPAPSTLVCGRAAYAGAEGPSHVIVTTSAVVYAALTSPGRARLPVFTGSELAAMAVAVDHDRGSPAALTEWIDAKLSRGPAWRLTAAHALGAVVGRYDARGCTIGRVFGMLGLELYSVDVGDQIPSSPPLAAP